MKSILFILALLPTVVLAANTGYVDANRLRSMDHTKIWTPPSVTGTLSCIACTETLTNKTLTSPTINSATLSGPSITGVAGLADGALGAPSLSFTSDTDTGLYRVGANDLALVAGGHVGLDVKDNGTYSNLGMGGSASASSNYPLLAQRSLAGVVNFQVANPDTSAGSGAKWQLLVSSGNNGFETGVFSPSTASPDAYLNGNATIRSTGTTAGIAYIADDSGTYHKFYVAGNGSVNEIVRITTGGVTLYNSGVFTGSGSGLTTLNASNLSSGTVAAARMPALTGDIATSAGAVATTLATVNSNVGTYGSASKSAAITVNAKGLITSVTENNITGSPLMVPPSTQILTSGTTYQKDYTFIITSGSATLGATYTNNAVTFTVNATVASYTQVVMHGSGAPASSGTLTKASGTGDSTLTFSQVFSPLYLEVELVGAGASGVGGGSGSQGVGTAGDNSTFDNLTANGGGVGGSYAGGAGGSASGGSGWITDDAFTGQGGGNGGFMTNTSDYAYGAAGGSSGCGHPGGPAGGITTGGDGVGPGGGGGGGTGGSSASTYGGGGGGGGGCIRAHTSGTVAATYTYAIGAGHSGGTAGTGTGTAAGGAGLAGRAKVIAHYQ